jgi:hypothetical protein
MKNQTTYQTNLSDQTYNGWANYETWNVALWLQNDEGLDEIICDSDVTSYEDLLEILYDCGSKETPDGVKWNDPKVNTIELNSNIFTF